MAYTKQTWADLPSKTTPINANRLAHIEDGIFNAAQTADTAASTAGTAAANIGIVSGRVETLTGRVNDLDTAVSNKVDKVTGKGLSTNDYDDTDKGKVDSLGTASTKNSTSVVTQSSDLVESGAVKELVGWGNKNLLAGMEFGVINQSTGENQPDSTQSTKRAINKIKVKRGSVVTISGFNEQSNKQIRLFYYSTDGYLKTVTSNVFSTTYLSITIPSDTDFFRFQVANVSLGINYQVEEGSTATSYEPYHESVSDSLNTIYADNGVLGAKNLLPATLSKVIAINNVGTWSNNVYSYNGVNYTLTEENSYVTKIKVNGTATDLSVLKLCNGIKSLVGGKYILSGCPNGGSTSTYYLQGFRVESVDGQSGSVQDTGNGVAFDYLNTVTNDNFSIIVLKNATVNNADYYPMLRLASDTDRTYQPYTQTNRELTVNKSDNSVIGTVEDGTNPTKAYAVNEFMVRDGAFCQVTVPVTTSSTWTEGSNYTKKSIAEVLQSLMS